MSRLLNRRQFVTSLGALAAATSLPARSYARVLGANSRLRLASVGVAGKGWDDITHVTASPLVDVVALCDVDSSAQVLGRASEKFSAAKTYGDWRRLLDDAASFDAVTISTPDHMHAPISLRAMQLKKHVYCQKPLTHTVVEARQMRQVAEKFGVVTQMGNQIQSHEAYRTAVQLVHDGAIGKVREVHSWQSGTMGWLLEEDRPAGEDPVPDTLRWDDWLGVAPVRPYKKQIYHRFNWRGWQDFSSGQLGDFGCHILDPVFMALNLTAPRSVRADAPKLNREVWNRWSTVVYEFPGTQYTLADTIRVTWYDGDGKTPPRDALGLPPEFKLPKAGSVLLGERGSLLVPHVAMCKLFPEEKFADFKLPAVGARDHYVSWADACRGEDKTTSHFAYAGNLTEAVLLGTIAVRLAGETLAWNRDKLEFSNHPAANRLLTKKYRSGWELTSI